MDARADKLPEPALRNDELFLDGLQQLSVEHAFFSAARKVETDELRSAVRSAYHI
jgi:hypothetical protein